MGFSHLLSVNIVTSLTPQPVMMQSDLRDFHRRRTAPLWVENHCQVLVGAANLDEQELKYRCFSADSRNE